MSRSSRGGQVATSGYSYATARVSNQLLDPEKAGTQPRSHGSLLAMVNQNPPPGGRYPIGTTEQDLEIEIEEKRRAGRKK